MPLSSAFISLFLHGEPQATDDACHFFRLGQKLSKGPLRKMMRIERHI